MPRRSNNNFHEHDFNVDERYESIINDTAASAGNEMGVKVDANPENLVQPQNPFHIKPKVDKEMEKFAGIFDGEEK